MPETKEPVALFKALNGTLKAVGVDLDEIEKDAWEEMRLYGAADLDVMEGWIDRELSRAIKNMDGLADLPGPSLREELLETIHLIQTPTSADITPFSSDVLPVLERELAELRRVEKSERPRVYIKKRDSPLVKIIYLKLRGDALSSVREKRALFGRVGSHEENQQNSNYWRRVNIARFLLLNSSRDYQHSIELFRDVEKHEGIDGREGKTVQQYFRRYFNRRDEEAPKGVEGWREYVKAAPSHLHE